MRRFKWVPFVLMLTAMISCGSPSDEIIDGDSTGDASEEGTSATILGMKTLAADYSAYDEEAIPSEALPVEEHGFITLNASSDGDVIIAGAAHGKLYYSDDGGITWYTLEGIGTEAYWSGATVSADGQEIAVAAQSLYISHDSGDTWTEYPFAEGYDSYSELAMSDDGSTIAMYAEYSFSLSYDYGETWVSPGYSSDNGLMAVDVSADGQKIGALHYFEHLRLSEDGGETWRAVTTDDIDIDPEENDSAGQWSDMDMSPDGSAIALLEDGGVKYEGEKKFDVYLSLDGTASWTGTMVEGAQAATSIAISSDGEKLLVSSNNVEDPFILSEDSGVTWNEIPSPEKENPDWPQYTHVFSNNGSRIVAMERSYSIWTSDDFGQTWIKRLDGQGAE